MEKTHLDICNDIYKPGMEIKSAYGGTFTIKDIPFRYGLFKKGEHVYANDGDVCLYNPFDASYAKIIKTEKKIKTQKLLRQGLKEIHSVACDAWKEILEKYGANNPLEDYIELTQPQVDTMFNSCTKEQLPIVSKYLKQDDGGVDVTKFTLSGKGFCDDNFYIIRDREWGEYKKQSFLLSERYDWEIKTDNVGQLCLIPTKKK